MSEMNEEEKKKKIVEYMKKEYDTLSSRQQIATIVDIAKQQINNIIKVDGLNFALNNYFFNRELVEIYYDKNYAEDDFYINFKIKNALKYLIIALKILEPLTVNNEKKITYNGNIYEFETDENLNNYNSKINILKKTIDNIESDTLLNITNGNNIISNFKWLMIYSPYYYKFDNISYTKRNLYEDVFEKAKEEAEAEAAAKAAAAKAAAAKAAAEAAAEAAAKAAEAEGGGKRKSKSKSKKVVKKPAVSQKKQSIYKEILGKQMKIYKIPDSRKEYVKYKGELHLIADYKDLMKQKAIAKTETKTKVTQQKAKSNTKK